MSKMFLLSNVLQSLALIPLNFFIMQFVLPADNALILSVIIVVITFLSSWVCSLNIKAYLHNPVSLAVSIFIGVASTNTVLGRLIVTVMFMVVLISIRYSLKKENDLSMQTAVSALIINVICGVINNVGDMSDSVPYGNAAICISVISAVILLIVRQVDDSRSFGKAAMDISRTQRKNNRIFGGVILLVLIIMGTFGRVSEIYKFVLRLIGRIFQFLVMLLSPEATHSEENQIPAQQFQGAKASSSLFDEILKVILDIFAVILIAAFTVYILYTIAKLIIKLVRGIIRWLANRESAAIIVNENGLIDEKQSLYGKNIKKITDRFISRTKGLFRREVPYSKLPDRKAKIRRLFRNFVDKSRQIGVNIKKSSTADEISRGASEAVPSETEINSLMSESYNAVRYGDIEPSPGDLEILEKKFNIGIR